MQNKKSLTSWGVLVSGLVFAAMGALSLSIGRRFNLGAGADFSAPPAVQTMVLLLLMFSMAAIPIFAVLLVDGFGHGEKAKDSLFGLVILAAVSEIPYNLAMNGKIFAMGSLNPVFALVLCELLLLVFEKTAGKGFLSVLISIGAGICGVFLCRVLGLMEYGLPLLLATWVVWGFRAKPGARPMAALIGALVCALLGLAYLTAPIGALVIYFYHGEKSEKKYLPLYLAYPVILLVSFGVSFLF